MEQRRHLHLTSADRNKTLKYYLVSLQKCRGAKSSSFSRCLSLQSLLKKAQYGVTTLLPVVIIWFATQAAELFVDVKYLYVTPRAVEPVEPGAVVETDSYIVFLNSETWQNQNTNGPRQNVLTFKKKPDWILV